MCAKFKPVSHIDVIVETVCGGVFVSPRKLFVLIGIQFTICSSLVFDDRKLAIKMESLR